MVSLSVIIKFIAKLLIPIIQNQFIFFTSSKVSTIS